MSMSESDVIDITDDVEEYPVCLGPHRSSASPRETSFTCILCQEEEELTSDCRTLVTTSFIHSSKVLCRSVFFYLNFLIILIFVYLCNRMEIFLRKMAMT